MRKLDFLSEPKISERSCFVTKTSRRVDFNSVTFLLFYDTAAAANDCCLVKAGEKLTFSSKLKITLFSESTILPNFAI